MASGGRKVFKKLAEPREAVERAAALIGSRARRRLLSEAETVGVEDLHGRLLARPVRAPRSLPWYPRSIVDGCAVRSVDVAGAFEDRPVALEYRGRVKIGEKPGLTLEPGSCIEVDTGSWVPLGADAVVPIEHVNIEGGRAWILRAATPGSNIAAPASDVAEGDLIAPAGTPWTPELTPALAALGIRRVEASRRPLAAVFSVGDELVEPGSDPGEAGVFDANRYYLASALKAMGWRVLDLGIAGDRVEDVEDRVARALERGADLVLTSGGTSAGIDDVVYRVASRMGSLVAHGLRIKPGKPTVISVVDSTPFIGLPGNPRSAFNVFLKVVVDLLDTLRLPTWPFTRRGRVRAVLTSMLAGERGRDTTVPVALVGEAEPAAVPVARDSYMIASQAWSDGDVVVPASLHSPYEPGEAVEVETRGSHRRRLLVLADDIDVAGVVEEHGLDGAVYAPTAKPSQVMSLLPRGALVVASTITLPSTPEGWTVEGELGERRVSIAKSSSGDCQRTAIPAVYTSLRPANTIPYPVPRIQSARILLSQGYVDCAILPGSEGEVVGEERILILRKK
ncbi:molybdopterin molybdotransferase MoeA [Stetteria hydrogenophila]